MGTTLGLKAAIWALLVTQVVHGAVPAETESDTVVGFYAGLLLLAATIAAVVGVMRGDRWGARLATVTGFAVGIGFVLYHAIPLETPLTNPYPGEPVGAAAWLSVTLAVAAGLWAGFEGLRVESGDEHLGAVTG